MNILYILYGMELFGTVSVYTIVFIRLHNLLAPAKNRPVNVLCTYVHHTTCPCTANALCQVMAGAYANTLFRCRETGFSDVIERMNTEASYDFLSAVSTHEW